jgi:hypothetical protein
MSPEEKVVDKIRKLHAHAESAQKIGNRAEAEAFAAMVNQMLLKHNLDMCVLEWEQRGVEDPIEEMGIDFPANGLPRKRARCQWSEEMAAIIARAHFCKILVMPGSNKIFLVGHRSNREVAEYLFVTMHKLADRLADRAYDVYFREMKRQGDCTRARGFRSAWLLGFIRGLAERFAEERRKSDQSAVGTTALIRVNQTLAVVEKWYADRLGKNARTAASLNSYRIHSEGIRRGYEAAREVSLRANAIKHNPGQGQKQIG